MTLYKSLIFFILLLVSISSILAFRYAFFLFLHAVLIFFRLTLNETKLNISWFKISIWLCLTEILCTFETHLNLDRRNATTNQPTQNVMLCGLFRDSVEWHRRFIISFSWDMTLRHGIIGSWYFEGMYCPHRQLTSLRRPTDPWKWRQCFPSKRRDPIIPWYTVIRGRLESPTTLLREIHNSRSIKCSIPLKYGSGWFGWELHRQGKLLLYPCILP